jgi:hypothetical protein
MSPPHIFKIVDLATNNSYEFEPDTPIIIGRGEKFGIQDRTVSRKQGELSGWTDVDVTWSVHISACSTTGSITGWTVLC